MSKITNQELYDSVMEALSFRATVSPSEWIRDHNGIHGIGNALSNDQIDLIEALAGGNNDLWDICWEALFSMFEDKEYASRLQDIFCLIPECSEEICDNYPIWYDRVTGDINEPEMVMEDINHMTRHTDNSVKLIEVNW